MLQSMAQASRQPIPRLPLLALACIPGMLTGCWRAGPPPYDPNARVYTEEELSACLGNNVGEVKRKVGVQAATNTTWLSNNERLYGMRYELPGTEMLIFLAEQDPMYEKRSRYSSWDYDDFARGRVGGISCRTERSRVDVGTVPAPWR